MCRLEFLLTLASAVILRSESRGTDDHILLSQIRDSTNLEGQIPVFISPRNRMARLYTQIMGSLFVASYDSQGYGGVFTSRCLEMNVLYCWLLIRCKVSTELLPINEWVLYVTILSFIIFKDADEFCDKCMFMFDWANIPLCYTFASCCTV
jgi:hypothetical protein